ncbi:hypothetical protein K438DRAFT_1848078 [Mycena galopus ATCC 62051]|nr:hypothetical protein K438DRAFT_1848078 [Mycena galopus ATCC 62051]
MQVSLAPLFACLALPSLPFHPALTSQPALPVLPDARSHRICLLRMAALRAHGNIHQHGAVPCCCCVG